LFVKKISNLLYSIDLQSIQM